MSENYIIGAGQIFTLLFVMLGPLKMLGPYAKATHTLSPEKLRSVSLKATVIALISLLIGGYIGKFLLGNWGIPLSVLELTSGVVFLIMALIIIFIPRKEEPAGVKANSETEVRPPAVAFSMIVTPYGVAVVIALLAASVSLHRTLLILGLLVFVLFLDLLAMLYIRQLMGKTGTMIMQMLGAVLAVLQAALAVQMIILALKLLKNDLPIL